MTTGKAALCMTTPWGYDPWDPPRTTTTMSQEDPLQGSLW
jgi:hypothetical protein